MPKTWKLAVQHMGKYLHKNMREYLHKTYVENLHKTCERWTYSYKYRNVLKF